MSAPKLELFQNEDCPYSHAVRERLSELGLDFISRSVSFEEDERAKKTHERLVQAGGQDQVPFLIDHTTGERMYESEDIIAYLDRKYG